MPQSARGPLSSSIVCSPVFELLLMMMDAVDEGERSRKAGRVWCRDRRGTVAMVPFSWRHPIVKFEA